MFEQWSAGFGDVVTRVRVNGPGTFRFEITAAGAPMRVFHSSHEVAMAIYHSGQPVTDTTAMEHAATLAVTGADKGIVAARLDPGAGRAERTRFNTCGVLARRLVHLTDSPWCYPNHPHYHPDWRIDETANPMPVLYGTGPGVPVQRHGDLVGVTR